ncbi:hypothetical protein D3C71_1572600 [compost metagenome]
MRRAQRHPRKFGDFRLCAGHADDPHQIGMRPYAVPGFVHRPGLEPAQRYSTGRVQGDPEFFVQLTRQGDQGRFTGLGLAAGLDEGVRAVFAHDQYAAAGIENDRGDDIDRRRGVLPVSRNRRHRWITSGSLRTA